MLCARRRPTTEPQPHSHRCIPGRCRKCEDAAVPDQLLNILNSQARFVFGVADSAFVSAVGNEVNLIAARERSRIQLRRTREVYWLEASERATMVIENTTPATVIMELAMAASSPREPAAPAPNSSGQRASIF